jgi:hypothetical protein
MATATETNVLQASTASTTEKAGTAQQFDKAGDFGAEGLPWQHECGSAVDEA